MKIDRFNAKFELWKDFSFEAAHHLNNVPAWHKCRRPHGHSYGVRIHCSGLLHPGHEWLVDYGEISSVVLPFIEILDHRDLNGVLKDKEGKGGKAIETTAENLAWWLAVRIGRRLPELSAVEVFETPTTSVKIFTKAGEGGV